MLGWRGDAAARSGGIALTLLAAALIVAILASVTRAALAGIATTRAFVALLIAWSVARAAVACMSPILGDEAYHWQWAKHLDLCYYDHPAMIAWIARLAAPWPLDVNICLRLAPLILSGLIPWLVFRLAKQTIGDLPAALAAGALALLTPATVGGFVLMPYVPLNFFWLAAAVLTWRAIEKRRVMDWLAAGVATGLTLNCNFTAALLPTSIFAFLLCSRRDRNLLLTPGPWLALLATAGCFAPVLIWNAQHDWATFSFNLSRRHEPFRFHAESLASYIGQLLLLLSPVVLIKCAVSIFRRPAADPEHARGRLYLLCFALVPLLAFLITGLGLKPRGHYAMPAFAPLLILFVDLCRRTAAASPSQPLRASRWYTAAVRVGAGCSAALLLGACLLQLVPPDFALRTLRAVSARDPEKRVAEIFGWPSLATRLDAMGTTYDAHSPTVVLAPSYSQASLLMYYSDRVQYAYDLRDRRSHYGRSFALWGPSAAIAPGAGAIIFWAGDKPSAEEGLTHFAPDFERVEPVKTGGRFTILHAAGFRGWTGDRP